jgi:hypothetical protein
VLHPLLGQHILYSTFFSNIPGLYHSWGQRFCNYSRNSLLHHMKARQRYQTNLLLGTVLDHFNSVHIFIALHLYKTVVALVYHLPLCFPRHRISFPPPFVILTVTIRNTDTGTYGYRCKIIKFLLSLSLMYVTMIARVQLQKNLWS